MKKDYKKDSYFIAEIEIEIVGFCRYIDNNFYISNLTTIDCEIVALYVKSDFKGMGVGKTLFKFVFNKFKNKNRTTIWLCGV